jgi:hypothetical protein
VIPEIIEWVNLMKKISVLKRATAVFCGLALVFTLSAVPTPLNPVEAVTAANTASYEWKNVTVGGGGGFLDGIVYNPTEEGLVYARTDMGGAYRRDKTTGNWIPLTDWVSPEEWNLLGIESLATDPVEPNRLYLALGTYTNSWTSMNGYIAISEDYGDTFDLVEMPFKMGGNMPGRGMGERLNIDPNSNNVLYMGARGMSAKGETEGSLWRSEDYGKTWDKVEGLPTGGPFIEDKSAEYSWDPQGVIWTAFDKSSSKKGTPCQTIYVGVADKDCPIIMSNDGGETWEPMTNQPVADTFTKRNPEVDFPIGIPHHGVLTDNGILYVTYSDRAGPYQSEDGALFKCDTKTMTWTDITPYLSCSYGWYELPDGTSAEGFTYEYGTNFGFGGLAVDPQDPDTIMTASMQSWWPDNYIFRSNDGGVTWNNSGTWVSYPSRFLNYTLDISAAPWLDFGKPVNATDGGELAAGDNPSPKIGWMIEAMAINPFNSDEMMYGTGATLYRTDNATVWDDYVYDYSTYPATVTRPEDDPYMNIYSAANGIEETAVLDLIVPEVDGVKLISGLGDINGFVHTDVNKPMNMMSSLVMTSGTGLDYAGNNPNYIVRVGNGDPEQYTPTKHVVAISEDGGATWSEPSNPLYASVTGWDAAPQGGNVAVSADGSSFVWAPADGFAVGVFIQGGWKEVETLPSGAWVASDRVNDNIFYATAGDGFYKSTDGGMTFELIDNLPEIGIPKPNAVPDNEGHVWLPIKNGDGNSKTSDNGGFYFSQDGGETWDVVSNGSKAFDYASVVGFGKAAEGETYPAIYTCAKIGGEQGVFRSDDMGENWVRINDDAHQYGSNNYVITGDMREYGTVYYGANGRGIIMGFLSDTPNTGENGNKNDDDDKNIVYGDVDCDGDACKITDIILLSKHISKKLTLPAEKQHYKNSNCYQKGTNGSAVDTSDLKTIIDILLGSKITLPVK